MGIDRGAKDVEISAGEGGNKRKRLLRGWRDPG